VTARTTVRCAFGSSRHRCQVAVGELELDDEGFLWRSPSLPDRVDFYDRRKGAWPEDGIVGPPGVATRIGHQRPPGPLQRRPFPPLFMAAVCRRHGVYWVQEHELLAEINALRARRGEREVVLEWMSGA
jgi:hypothetical protein